VQFNFQGAETGIYPNGSNFNKTDIITDNLLERAHSDLDLKVPYDKFVKAISVNSTPDFIEDFKKLNENISAKDLKNLPEQTLQNYYKELDNFMTSLKEESNSYAEIVLNNTDLNITEKQANDIISDLLSIWQSYMISEVGILNKSDTLLNLSPSSLVQSDLIIAINGLFDYVDNFERRIKQLIQATPASKNMLSTTHSMSFDDILFLLNQERINKLSVAQRLALQYTITSNSTVQNSYLETQIAGLKRKIEELHGKIRVYDQALSIFDQSASENLQKAYSTDENQDTLPISTNNTQRAQIYSPQYSDAFVNTMLDLGTKISDPSFRKSLITSKIETSQKLEETKSKLRFYTEPAITEWNPSKNEIEELLKSSRDNIDNYRTSFNEISTKISQGLLNTNGGLYRTIAKLQVAAGYKLNDSKFSLKLIIMFLAGGFLGLVFIFTRNLLSPSK
jgi:hypothetical protein